LFEQNAEALRIARAALDDDIGISEAAAVRFEHALFEVMGVLSSEGSNDEQ
jgi:hypothetical protein